MMNFEWRPSVETVLRCVYFSTLVNIFKYMSTFWGKSIQQHFEKVFVSNKTRRDVAIGPCPCVLVDCWAVSNPWLYCLTSPRTNIICQYFHSKQYLVGFAFVSWYTDSSITLKHNIPLLIAFVLFKWFHYGKALRAQSNGLIDDGRGFQTFLQGDGMIKLDVLFKEKSLLSSDVWFGKTQRLAYKTMKWTRSMICCVQDTIDHFQLWTFDEFSATIKAEALIYS